MLTINLVFILRKSVNYSVNLFSNRNMNSATMSTLSPTTYTVTRMMTSTVRMVQVQRSNSTTSAVTQMLTSPVMR